MYVPDRYAEQDPATIRAFIDAHPFALLVTTRGGAPHATHLPLLLEGDVDSGSVVGHVAKGNPQWRDFDGETEALAVFHGPHAYVSPTWYGATPYVPTWNYAAVHLAGRPVVIDDHDEHRRALALLTERFEDPSAPGAWSMDGLPVEYREAMQAGTVAFRMPVERVEAAFKLSQNRTPEIRARVRDRLASSEDSAARAVADLMRERSGDEP